MKISMRGKSPVLTTKETKYVLNFFANILLGPRLSKNVSVEFAYVDLPSPRLYGRSIPMDYYERNTHNREFAIEIDPRLDRESHIRTIAHEMEHVRQYARGDLVDEGGANFRWMRMPYELTEVNYPFVPWEREAKASEGWLLHFYREHTKLHSLSF